MTAGRIAELLAELAPNGVEHKALGEFAELVRGNGMPKTDLADEGVGAIHYGQIYTHYGTWATETISFVAPETAARLATAEPGDLIVTNTSENLDDVGKAVAWLGDAPVVTGGHATVIKRHGQDPKYLAYWFQSPSFREQKKGLATGTKVIDVPARQLAKLRIPLPTLAMQREVARVLDSFADLGATLEVELAARHRQYRHYRQSLLTFGEEVEWRELHELFTTRNGYTPSKSDPSLWADGDVPWFRMEDIRTNGNVLSDALQRVPHTAVKGGRLFPANSILVATSATIGEHALITVPHLSNQRFTSLAPKPEFTARIDMRFMHYYCFVLDEWCRNNTTVSSFASVDMAGFRRFRFPVPPLEEQRRIADILDSFDALVNDRSAGIPAEIAARRTQYEHYRDRLLTFPEASA